MSLILIPILELQHALLSLKCYEPGSVPQFLILSLFSPLDSQLSLSRSLGVRQFLHSFLNRTCSFIFSISWVFFFFMFFYNSTIFLYALRFTQLRLHIGIHLIGVLILAKGVFGMNILIVFLSLDFCYCFYYLVTLWYMCVFIILFLYVFYIIFSSYFHLQHIEFRV